MSDFDDIRPYNDNEVAEVFQRLARDNEFIDTLIRMKFGVFALKLKFVLRPLLRITLAWIRKRIGTIAELQAEIEQYLVKSLDDTTSSITVSGLDKLDPQQSYLFISNHRDIAMDPAMVNLALYRAKFGTLRIAIGDNLLTKPFTSDLMRLNKCFIVKRSLTKPREKLKAAKVLSAYIQHSVLNDGENVWIAQREGRAKDGLDRTNAAIISMLALNKPKTESLGEFVQKSRIVPVTIAYEYDPCDADKARELVAVRETGRYEKQEHEDIQSIARGITGYKGHVHLSFGEPLTGDFEDSEDVSAELDKQILANYQLHATNAIAYELLEGEVPAVIVGEQHTRYQPASFVEEKRRFEARLAAIEVPHQQQFLRGYANPVKDRLASAKKSIQH